MAVTWLERTPPLPWTRATFAFSTCRPPHSPRSWRTASTIRSSPYIPGWARYLPGSSHPSHHGPEVSIYEAITRCKPGQGYIRLPGARSETTPCLGSADGSGDGPTFEPPLIDPRSPTGPRGSCEAGSRHGATAAHHAPRPP